MATKGKNNDGGVVGLRKDKAMVLDWLLRSIKADIAMQYVLFNDRKVKIVLFYFIHEKRLRM